MNKMLIQLKYILLDFIKRFVSLKTGTLFLLQLFVLFVYLTPLKEYAEAIRYPVTPWLMPFLFSNVYFTFFFTCGAVYYYSDIPFMQHSEMYALIRAGRIKWGISKIAGIILGGFAFSAIEIVLSVLPLFPFVDWNTGWGKLLHTLSMTDAASQYGINLFVPYEILSNYSAIEAVGISFLIGGLVATFLGILMFFISLYFSRLTAICAAMFFAILSVVVYNIRGIYHWVIYLSPVSWLNLMFIDKGNSQGFDMLSFCVFVLLAVIALGSILILWKLKSTDYDFVKED